MPVLLIAVAVLSASCGGPAVDKLGAPIPQPVVRLKVGVSDPGDAAFTYFVEAAQRASEGRIQLDVDRTTYYSQTPGGEANLAGALRSGTVDLAYIPSRDWAETGDIGFRAVQSPFLITTTAATIALVESQAAGELLRGMAARGVIGIGLVPAQPRRLVTRFPLVAERDLTGARIRINPSSQTASMLVALGAEPLPGTTEGVRQALESGKLEGVEAAPRYVVENSYNVAAPYLTSFGLIPKLEIIAASNRAWSVLAEQDRRALESAATETAQRESAQLPQDEQRDLTTLCANGLVLVRAGEGTLAGWRERALESSPAGSETMAVIDQLAATVAGLGPQPDGSDVPASCHVATSAAQARELQGAKTPTVAPSIVPGERPFPTGTYVVTVTVEQWRAAGLVQPYNAVDVTYTCTFRRDGTFYVTQVPDFPDTQGPLSGRYSTRGNVLTFTYDPSPTGSLAPESVRWSLLRGTLTLTVVSVQDEGSRTVYRQPWHKVA